MKRRRLLQLAAALPVLSLARWAAPARAAAPFARVRPGDPNWPSEASWDELNQAVGGRLIKVKSPLAACAEAPSDSACAQVFKELKNPYYLGDEVALTQTLGWVGAWTSQPSVYAVGPNRRATWSPRSISRARTACGWSSKAAATLIRANRMQPTRF